MTREEAIKIIKECKEKGFKHTFYTLNQYHEAIDIAIKALEQEPCEDEYIKVPKKALKYRTAGMVAYNVEWLKNNFDIERAVICGAQEPKTGHWIADVDKWGDVVTTINGYKCSECGEFNADKDNYCPNCGAKMQEVEE